MIAVSPMCVYLDMNVWINLARGLKERSGPWHEGDCPDFG